MGGGGCVYCNNAERERDWPIEVERERDGSAWTCVSLSGMYQPQVLVQELCESQGGHPGLSVLTSLLVSVDVKLY